MSENHPVFKERIVTSTKAKSITINGIDCLNAGTHNYLGLLNADDIQESAISSINKYGVGSCGPRGFYGTIGATKTAIELILLNTFDSFPIFKFIDVHLELEERLAKFMEMEESVLYAYGFATTASAIPAYCKRGDLVFV